MHRGWSRGDVLTLLSLIVAIITFATPEVRRCIGWEAGGCTFSTSQSPANVSPLSSTFSHSLSSPTIIPSAQPTPPTVSPSLFPSPTVFSSPTRPYIAQLTPEKLANAEYCEDLLCQDSDRTIWLSHGVYRSDIHPEAFTQLLDGTVSFGDLNNDGIPDAVVVLGYSGGGSGFLIRLIVILNDGGKPKHLTGTILGDRVSVKSTSIESGQILVELDGRLDMLQPQPVQCDECLVLQTYELKNSQLVLVSRKILQK